ncbi:MAG: hypothetical protein OXI54_10835 [Chloroflexota bacterium]|nr:hypothetical protein [Chloroflexota bacterium]MDE2684625.1 hypothetical protein [Chloroflexota bacterium]
MDSGTKETGQCADGEGDAVGESGQYPASSRSLDSLDEMRLVALLGDMIDEQGKPGAAETLGVSVRTLGRFEESRRLTRTVAAALEAHLLRGGGSAADRQRRQAADVAERVAALEKALPEGLAALRQEGQDAVGEQAKVLGELARRVAALEAAGSGVAQGNAGTPPGSPAPVVAPPVGRPRRVYPDLVTAEAEPGEELVYGEAATAVIAKWREARDAVGQPRDALDRLDARRRRYELEIELIEQHELTLPPATRSWDWGDRRQEIRRRNEALDEIMVDRRMLKLRRFLTLGLWRK